MNRRLKLLSSMTVRSLSSLMLAGAGAAVLFQHQAATPSPLSHSKLASSFIPSLNLAGADGSTYALNAVNYGSTYSLGLTGLGGSHPLAQPIVGMADNPAGGGYWLVAKDGGVFNFGDAGFYGNPYTLGLTGLTGSHPLDQPIVGMAATPDGKGYWLVARDGGIFNFGDAGFYGNPYTDGLTGLTGSHPLSAPIVGMAATTDGKGYWLVGADGGVFNFGDAGFYGSTYTYGITGLGGSHPLSAPVVGMAATPDGQGYWLVGADGGVFNFGDAPGVGSEFGVSKPAPVVGIASDPIPPGVQGYDVSNSQCGSLPKSGQQLAIVETNGWPFSYDYPQASTNTAGFSSCEQQAMGLAGAQTQLYLFAGYWGPLGNGQLSPSSLYGSGSFSGAYGAPAWTGSSYQLPSAAASTLGCAQYAASGKSCASAGSYFVNGFDEALFAYITAQQNAQPAGLSAILNNTWWLDVETSPGSQWVRSGTANYGTDNYDTILGAMAGLEYLGVPRVGVYSTHYQYGIITAGSPGTLPPTTPLWVPTESTQSQMNPQLVCTGQAGTDYLPFGGHGSYIQYVQSKGTIDIDTECSSL